jgi:hypothetical protein
MQRHTRTQRAQRHESGGLAVSFLRWIAHTGQAVQELGGGQVTTCCQVTQPPGQISPYCLVQLQAFHC